MVQFSLNRSTESISWNVSFYSLQVRNRNFKAKTVFLLLLKKILKLNKKGLCVQTPRNEDLRTRIVFQTFVLVILFAHFEKTTITLTTMTTTFTIQATIRTSITKRSTKKDKHRKDDKTKTIKSKDKGQRPPLLMLFFFIFFSYWASWLGDSVDGNIHLFVCVSVCMSVRLFNTAWNWHSCPF